MKKDKEKNEKNCMLKGVDHLQNGEKAIKIHQDIVEHGKTQKQKDEDEKKDAEKWHNEG